MFGRKKSKYDPFLGLAEVRAAHADLARGDWTAAQALLAHGGDRSMVVGLLTEAGVPTDVYKRWVAASPDTSSYTLLSRKLIADAWDIRGGGYAKTVGEEAWKGFGATLREAQNAVDEAIRLGPSNADAWASNVQIGIGRSTGIAQIQASYERAHALQPFHAAGTGSLLQARCEKWFGDHESMFTFARWVSAQAGPAAPVQWVIVRAHYERWASMRDEGVAQGHYFSQPNVRDEILTTATRFLESTPAGRAASADQLSALNWFVYGLGHATGAPKPVIAECADRIARRPTSWPWIAKRGEHGEAYDRFLKQTR